MVDTILEGDETQTESGSGCEGEDPRLKKVRPMQAAKTFKVTITAKPGAGVDPIDWDYDSNLKKGSSGHLVFNKNDDGMKKYDYYLVEFGLDDETNLGLQFEPNPMNAFWVVMGDNVSPPPCPQTAHYESQIYAICDDPNGRALTVRNEDDTVQFFRFSLGFIDRDGNPHRFDPIGQNQNSGRSSSTNNIQ
jgi:hypothetical protein